jgi:asparagine synthase (glutamine-hydrolysing)
MRQHLPDDILYRPKQGFVTPIQAWFRGPLAGAAREIGASAALGRTGWFDSKRLIALAEGHRAGTADNSRVLWQLLMLDRSLTQLGLA